MTELPHPGRNGAIANEALLRGAGRLMLFAVRHALASFATIAAGGLAWTVVYLGLFVGAIVTNEDLGGPLAFPLGLVMVMAAAAFVSGVICFPSTAIAGVVSDRAKLPVVSQLPMSLAMAAAICGPLALFLHWLRDLPLSPTSVARNATLLFAVTLLPLVFYWTVATIPTLLIGALRAIRAAIRLPRRPIGSS